MALDCQRETLRRRGPYSSPVGCYPTERHMIMAVLQAPQSRTSHGISEERAEPRSDSKDFTQPPTELLQPSERHTVLSSWEKKINRT